MSALSLTPAQASAVTARGSALLVSAAAGSGKTKVLVERLLSYVTDEQAPCDITDFLVITYTRAAAAELKSRIADEISARMALAPDSRHLRRQAALVSVAGIDTIHGFCTGLLRENAHLLQIPPDFRVADDSESRLLKDSVLDELLERRYEEIGTAEGFRLLVDTLSAGRDDKRLGEVILDAHGALLSHADPEGWIKAHIATLEQTDTADASETVWGRYLMDDARRKAVYWREELIKLLDEAESCPDFKKAYGDSLNISLSGLNDFIEALDIGWDEARAISAVEFPRAKSLKGYDELKEVRTRCKDALKKLTAVFEYASRDLLEDMAAVRPAVTALLDLVLEFDAAYADAKRRRGVVDFSDQEHLAVRLLTDKGAPSDLSRAVSGRYREILIDEYQDCSAVQELIFNAVSQSGQNIFMVGDVKQSIYRFRLADPTIFLSKYKSYQDYEADREPEGEGRRILLSTNFRSAKPVLDAANFIFRNIMSEELGDLDYTEREYLYPGRSDAADKPDTVEIDILDMHGGDSGEEDEEAPDKTALEAAFVADRIETLLRDMVIPDGRGGFRPLRPGDIAILLRSVREKAPAYAQALADRHIPAGLPGSEGFFETPEIELALAILDIIDNPMQDVPLITVLRSPVYGFSPDELAAVRVADKSGDLYTALVKAAENDGKCRAFLDELQAYRETAPDMPADRLLWHVYNKTGLLGVVGALRDGQARRDNLLKLAGMAGRFEANGYKGVYGFMRFIRQLLELGGDAGDTAETVSSDAVNIMSIHKSKGLEFPVVILADTSKRFNLKDTTKQLLIHAGLGVGMKRTDFVRRIEYPTLARLAVSKALTRETLSEELRVLYVALTRAREKLIVVATFPDAARELGKLTKMASQPVPPQLLEGMNCMAQLILTPVLTRPEAASLRGETGVVGGESGTPGCGSKAEDGTYPLFDIRMISRNTNESVPDDEDIPAPWEVADAEEDAADGCEGADSIAADAPAHSTDSLEPFGGDTKAAATAGGEIQDDSEEESGTGDDAAVCADEDGADGSPVESEATGEAEADALEQLRRNLSYRYPYKTAETLPSKLTATELKGRLLDLEASEEAEARVYAKKPGYIAARPGFAVEKTALTAAERGTALHLAMQYIDYTQCQSLDSIKAELVRLREKGFLSAKQYEAVDARKIAAFFASTLGRRVVNADRLYREFKFSLLLKAYDERVQSEDEACDEDEILFQGVIDCCFEENGVLHVIDFKSDVVTPETIGGKAELYAEQIRSYGQAMTAITGKPVESLTLYFFCLDKDVPIY